MRLVSCLARAATAIACLAPLAAAADAAAPPVPAPKVTQLGGERAESLIWVGNSFFFFNNGIHRYVNGLASAAGKDARLRNVLVTIGGSGIDWHDLDNYLKPDSKVGWYSFVGDNEIRFNKPGRQFDTVVIMDCSQCPIHAELGKIFREYARKDAEIARKYGVRPVLFMSWAYKDVPSMTAALAAAYTEQGNANDMLVIPAGLAFARSVARRPELELYQPDKRHPTLAGTYLAACTSFAALTGRSPVGNTYTGGLDAATARFLQEIAWETVGEYYRVSSTAAR